MPPRPIKRAASATEEKHVRKRRRRSVLNRVIAKMVGRDSG